MIIMSNTSPNLPPNGHTSIYLCQELKNNWIEFRNFMTARGSISFNQHTNRCLVDDFHTNYSTTMNQRFIRLDKKIDFYNDSISMIKEKLLLHSEGEHLDLLKSMTPKVKVIRTEITRRGIRI